MIDGTGGLIDTPTQVGGIPVLAQGTPPTDTDHDGMPDAWESQYGLDPDSAADGPQDADLDGYTNLEEFLSGGSPQVDPLCGSHPRGCSITGGFVYRGCALPDLHGRYFYSDYCGAWLRSFQGVSGGDAQNLLDHTADVNPTIGGFTIDDVTTFGEDARGELYIADQGGQVYRLVPGS